jgi:hypothetical protein
MWEWIDIGLRAIGLSALLFVGILMAGALAAYLDDLYHGVRYD